MTRHVCAICGYSTDSIEDGRCSYEAIVDHMYEVHMPRVVFHNDFIKDEITYKLFVPSGLNDSVEDAMLDVKSFKDAFETENAVK